MTCGTRRSAATCVEAFILSGWANSERPFAGTSSAARATA